MIVSHSDLSKPTLHGSHSCSKLEIRGHFHITGPQPVGVEGGAPQWAYDLMKDNPRIESIAVAYEGGGVVWSKMKE